MFGPTEGFALVCALFVFARYAMAGFRLPKTPREEAHRRMLIPCLLALLATRGHVFRSLVLALLVGASARQFDLLEAKVWVSGTFLAYGDWMVPYVAIYVVMFLFKLG